MALWEALKAYDRTDAYPMHMPGHKRRGEGAFDWYAMDITEIDGFDNLHDAQGVLKYAMERAARVVGAERSWFLVNGSTCGLLAAVFAAVRPGEKVLAARNCHKAVYHALALRGAVPVWLYPPTEPLGYAGALPLSLVEEALSRDAYAACILTSPTYEGVTSDVAGIARACRRRGTICIVDEAHGAHLPIGGREDFPESAVSQGADLVIQSLHKTLPSPTQTALLSLCGSRVPAERVETFLAMFETSSPSYPLMAGMDACMEWAEAKGREAMRRYARRLAEFYRKSEALKELAVLPPAGRDPGKLLIFDRKFRMTGREIYDILKDEFSIQPEMAAERYALLMTSPCDTDEGFARLSAALAALDKRLPEGKGSLRAENGSLRAENGRLPEEKRSLPTESEQLSAKDGRLSAEDERLTKREERGTAPWAFPQNEVVLPMLTALEAPGSVRKVSELTGAEISGEWVTPYPPGIPVLAPGERVGAALPWLKAHREELRIAEIEL